MRDKESKQDYRFMPEPNLPPLHLHYTTEHSSTGSQNVVYVDELEKQMPVLPQVERARLIEKYGLSIVRANMIVVRIIMNVYAV